MRKIEKQTTMIILTKTNYIYNTGIVTGRVTEVSALLRGVRNILFQFHSHVNQAVKKTFKEFLYSVLCEAGLSSWKI